MYLYIYLPSRCSRHTANYNPRSTFTCAFSLDLRVGPEKIRDTSRSRSSFEYLCLGVIALLLPMSISPGARSHRSTPRLNTPARVHHNRAQTFLRSCPRRPHFANCLKRSSSPPPPSLYLSVVSDQPLVRLLPRTYNFGPHYICHIYTGVTINSQSHMLAPCMTIPDVSKLI
jgi:hypothetical protein